MRRIQAQNTVPCESWVMFSIISRNNIPGREHGNTNAKTRGKRRMERERGELSKSHAYKSVELLCAPVPFCSWHCALALAAEQILYESKQVDQRPFPSPTTRSQVTLETGISLARAKVAQPFTKHVLPFRKACHLLLAKHFYMIIPSHII